MSGTNVAGYVQLIMAGLSAFVQIWGVVHGMPMDTSHGAVTVGLAASGAGHLARK